MDEKQVVSRVNIPFWKTTISGAAGGVSLLLIAHPFDTIKVLIQTMTIKPGFPPPYSSAFDCAKKLVQREGLKGLYKGFTAPLYVSIPNSAIWFSSYEVGKRIFTTEESFKDMKIIDIAFAGATCSVFTTAIRTPQERIKCILQIQEKGNAKYSGTIDCLKQLYKEGGYRSLNRGFVATLFRDLIGSSFYFASYEFLKYEFRSLDHENSLPYSALCAGGFAGIFGWMASIPLDTLKSKLQVAPLGMYPNGVRDVFREMVRMEGYRALYRGLGPILLRSFPSNAACLFGYETALRYLSDDGPKSRSHSPPSDFVLN